MKLFTMMVLLLLAFSSQSYAIARAQFLGMQAMINVTNPSLGDLDPDAIDLYRAMNVPIQDSFLGPGKAIVIGNKLLNLTCVSRRDKGFECSFLIQRSPQTTIDSSRGFIRFVSSGVEAEEVFRKFNLSGGSFKYTSIDQRLTISAEPNQFVLQYQE